MYEEIGVLEEDLKSILFDFYYTVCKFVDSNYPNYDKSFAEVSANATIAVTIFYHGTENIVISYNSESKDPTVGFFASDIEISKDLEREFSTRRLEIRKQIKDIIRNISEIEMVILLSDKW